MSMRPDEILFSKRRTLAIEVKADGRLIVRAPKGASQKRIQNFLVEKADWIRQARQRVAERQVERPALVFAEGASLPLFGQWYQLKLLPKVKGGLSFDPTSGFCLQSDLIGKGRALLVEFYREQVRQMVTRMVARHGGLWGLNASGIRVTSAATRWGSCSSKNALNFSYKLALLPLELVEYVVVHELAHIRHHNHSAAYWKLVSEMMPDFKARRARLKALAGNLPLI